MVQLIDNILVALVLMGAAWAVFRYFRGLAKPAVQGPATCSGCNSGCAPEPIER